MSENSGSEKKTRRKKGEGSLWQHENGTWYGQFRDRTGKQRGVTCGTGTERQAEQILAAAIKKSETVGSVDSDLKKLKYGDLRDALLESYRDEGNKSLKTVGDGEETIWGLKALDEFFGYSEKNRGWPILKIGTKDVRRFIDKRLAELNPDGTKFGGHATINRSLALLKRMFHLAMKNDEIRLPSMPNIPLQKEPPARKGFVPREKFEVLLSHMPDNLKPLITFLYYCGVRLGEAQQIQWSQVDLSGGFIRLESDQTKNKEARVIPLPNMLIRRLETHEPKQGPVFDSTNLRKAWQKACDKAGLGVLEEVEGKDDKRYTGLIIHDLRRSAIRNLVGAGISEKVAMTISGHKTRSVFDRYNIVNTDQLMEAMKVVQQQSPNVASQLQPVAQPRLVGNGGK